VGKPGKSHRVFIASADTFGSERADNPWQNFTSKDGDFSTVIEFMSGQTGPCDLLLFFDGRNPEDRAAMAESVSKNRHICEIWILYQSTKRFGRRSVAWSSDNKEIMWISLPLPRVHVPTKEHTGEVAKWAESTHSTCYVNVPQAPWQSLPLMTADDKANLTGKDQSVLLPPPKIFEWDRGVPVYWQERKTVEFWQTVLNDVDAGMVVDLTPGSGSAGRAAMRNGISYHAVCRDEIHASWLGNILDREACELIVKSESPLFEQSLAALIKAHFAEILAQLSHQANAQDEEYDGAGDE
jgi:hypothetical protein